MAERPSVFGGRGRNVGLDGEAGVPGGRLLSVAAQAVPIRPIRHTPIFGSWGQTLSPFDFFGPDPLQRWNSH